MSSLVLEGRMLALSEDTCVGQNVWVPALRTRSGWWITAPADGFTKASSGSGRTDTEVLAFTTENVVPGPAVEVVIRTKAITYELGHDGYRFESLAITVCGLDDAAALACAHVALSETDTSARRPRTTWSYDLSFEPRAAIVRLRDRCRTAGCTAPYGDGRSIPLPFPG